ncbi:MAG: hypothetical protein XD36_3291 [Halomonas sp. 54_146]|nr:MAG: hypothetical protein XD36_3291 [Halomonas sp. 54_146]
MNYLIKLLKSVSLLIAVKATGLPLNWLASARKAYSTHFLVVVNRCFLASEASDTTYSNLLTNQGFYTLCTAGNAWRPRQRMRTLRPDN